MRKVICLLFIAASFSCAKKENPTEVLFRNHLKESLGMYQGLCQLSESKLQQKEEDDGTKRPNSDTLRLVGTLFKEKFEKTKITGHSELLKLQSKLYSKFNLLYPHHQKYECEDSDKLIGLDTDILKLCIECDFYKTQQENFEYQRGAYVIADGIHFINPSQVKKIEALDKAYAKAVKEILKHKTNN